VLVTPTGDPFLPKEALGDADRDGSVDLVLGYYALGELDVFAGGP
jgi:hypothetical protein